MAATILKRSLADVLIKTNKIDHAVKFARSGNFRDLKG